MSPEWKTSNNFINYADSINYMEERVAKIASNSASELVWLLEHPSIYTAGTSANSVDLLNNFGFPVYNTGRGGQYTYHGPGQRIIYLMLNLKERNLGLREYVQKLEDWIISSLKLLNIDTFKREERIGIWTFNSKGQEVKIAAIGVRVRKWVSYHGIAINLTTNLENYKGIIPCGIREFGVTSISEFNKNISFQQLDDVLMRTFNDFF